MSHFYYSEALKATSYSFSLELISSADLQLDTLLSNPVDISTIRKWLNLPLHGVRVGTLTK